MIPPSNTMLKLVLILSVINLAIFQENLFTEKAIFSAFVWYLLIFVPRYILNKLQIMIIYSYFITCTRTYIFKSEL